MDSPLSDLFEKNVVWYCHAEHDTEIKAIKDNLLTAPILPLPDPSSVFCDASYFAIGSVL